MKIVVLIRLISIRLGTTEELHKPRYKVLNGFLSFVSLDVLGRFPFARERKMTI